MGNEGEATKWILTFIDGGKAILTTTEHLERETYEHVLEMWSRFVKNEDQIMVIGGCRVERVGRVELDISAEAIIVRGHAAA